MQTSNYHYQLIQRITDESFDAEKLSSYALYLTYGKLQVRLAVLDLARNKFIYLEDYEVNHIFSPLQAAQVFREFFFAHPFLFKPDWKQIKVAVKNHSFTLIPATLFDPDAASDYLRLNCDIDLKQESIFSYHHQNLEAVNIFTADYTFLRVWEELVPQKKVLYLHQTSGLISGLDHYGERTDQFKLFVYIEKNNLYLLIFKENKLQFCNLFQCQTPEDFLYYLIFVMQEHKLNPESDRVTVWGEISHDSVLFNLMRKYIRHVQFGSRPTGPSYSYKLADIFDHHYLDLYSLYFCD